MKEDVPQIETSKPKTKIKNNSFSVYFIYSVHVFYMAPIHN